MRNRRRPVWREPVEALPRQRELIPEAGQAVTRQSVAILPVARLTGRFQNSILDERGRIIGQQITDRFQNPMLLSAQHLMATRHLLSCRLESLPRGAGCRGGRGRVGSHTGRQAIRGG